MLFEWKDKAAAGSREALTATLVKYNKKNKNIKAMLNTAAN